MAAPSKRAGAAEETIHALSSGALPAAIAVVRVSGAGAGLILAGLSGPLSQPRRASLRTLRDSRGDVLDRALVLWFPGPDTATGEDLAELHLHGGRAVVAAVDRALGDAGSRPAQAGEFTRRALLNNRLDLGEVEGLADLLSAETEYQRREALRRADGALGRRLAAWSETLLGLSARYEAAIDFDGEIEIEHIETLRHDVRTLAEDIDAALSRVSAERLRDGLRIAIVGPVNAGKSSLFNALLGSDAAIVSPIPGTTRDLIERPLAIGGLPFVLTDTAGLRSDPGLLERQGIERALHARAIADIVIDLGEEEKESGCPVPAHIRVTSKVDTQPARPGTIGTSATTGVGLSDLFAAIVQAGSTLLPAMDDVALSSIYRERLRNLLPDLREAERAADLVLAAEHLRHALEELDRLTGNSGFEDMLDTLFGRFCLGK